MPGFAQTIAAPLNKVAREFQSISGTPGADGGDEFVIFLCTEHGNSADAVARTKSLIREYNAHSKNPYYVELSIGATSFICTPEADVSALLRKADECLYAAKQKRRETSIRY